MPCCYPGGASAEPKDPALRLPVTAVPRCIIFELPPRSPATSAAFGCLHRAIADKPDDGTVTCGNATPLTDIGRAPETGRGATVATD